MFLCCFLVLNLWAPIKTAFWYTEHTEAMERCSYYHPNMIRLWLFLKGCFKCGINKYLVGEVECNAVTAALHIFCALQLHRFWNLKGKNQGSLESLSSAVQHRQGGKQDRSSCRRLVRTCDHLSVSVCCGVISLSGFCSIIVCSPFITPSAR